MKRTRSTALVALFTILATLAAACGSSGDSESGATTAAPAPSAAVSTTPAASTAPASPETTGMSETTVAPETSAAPETTDAPASDFEATADDFRNLNDMTPVRGFFVDNLLGDLDATLAVAENVDGGVWPVGSLVQLIPTEAMIKRAPGFDPGSNDWEFFELTVDESGSSINVRGGAEVENFIGLSCAECHAKADAQFDFICEQGHGCDPLPFDSEFFQGLQETDPRPRLG